MSTAEYSVALMALNKMPNVLLTPHNAFNTDGAIGRINATTCQNIISFWYGDIPNLVKPVTPSTGKLLLVRHAESEWNVLGRWTGRTNVNLSEKGFHDASLLGKAIESADISIDQAFCSEQVRTLETLEIMLSAARQSDTPMARRSAINERDYGEYTAKNKWDMEKMVGEDEFTGIRRGWDHAVPGGETLKMVYERVVPFYNQEVVPLLKAGKNVAMVAHGNSLRALIKYIEDLSDEAIESLEMPFGTILVYDVDPDGHSLAKSSLTTNTPSPFV